MERRRRVRRASPPALGQLGQLGQPVAFPYLRVVESADFEAQLVGAPGSARRPNRFVYPVLAHEPTNSTGPFGIRSTDDGFYELDVEGEHGGEGFVRYQGLEDERLLMLFGFAWL